MLQDNTTDSKQIETVAEYSIDFTRLLYMHYQEMDILIARADLKAQLILAINAILIAGDVRVTVGQLAQLDAMTAIDQLLLATNGLVIISLLLSLAFAIITIYPRRSSPHGSQIYFFGDINSYAAPDYVDEYLSASLNDIKRGVISQIHAKSAIVARKFYYIRRSVVCLLGAVVFWGIAQLVLLASGG